MTNDFFTAIEKSCRKNGIDFMLWDLTPDQVCRICKASPVYEDTDVRYCHDCWIDLVNKAIVKSQKEGIELDEIDLEELEK